MRHFLFFSIYLFTFCIEVFAWGTPRSVNAIHYIRKSIDARYVGIGRMDGLITIYDIREKKIVKSFQMRYSKLIDFAPDEKHYIIQDTDKSILVKNIETDEVLFKVPLKDPITELKDGTGESYKVSEVITSVAMFKDMNRMLVGTEYGRLIFYNVNENKSETIKTNPKDSASLHPYLQIMISSDQSRFCTVTRFANMDTKEWGDMWKQKKPDVYRRWLCYGISIWDSSTMAPLGRYAGRYFQGHSSADMSSDGRWVVGHTEQGLACLLDAKTGETIWEPILIGDFKNGEMDAYHLRDSVVFLSGGKYFCTKMEGTIDKVFIYETENKKNKVLEYKCRNFGSNPTGFVSDQSRNLIIIGTSDGAIEVLHFNPEKKKIKRVWKAPPAKPLSKQVIINYSKAMNAFMAGGNAMN